jgi:hypothetical protein
MGMKKRQVMDRDCREWSDGFGSQGSKMECSFVEEKEEE